MIEYWRSNGRWYWHRIVSGNVTHSGSYKFKSSLRRAMRRWYPNAELREVVR